MAKRVYTDDQKATALAGYLEDGTAATAKALDIPPRTIRYWAGEAGLAAAKREQTEAASEALAADIADKRAGIRDLFLEAALHHANRSLAAGPRDAQALATASAIFIDKFRLEMGEATQVHESRSDGAADKVKATVDELSERRAEKTA